LAIKAQKFPLTLDNKKLIITFTVRGAAADFYAPASSQPAVFVFLLRLQADWLLLVLRRENSHCQHDKKRKEVLKMAMDILREMENLRREIDGAFKGFGTGAFLEPSFLPGVGLQRFPQVNLAQDKDNVYVEVLVPGVDAKDLELTVMQGTLTLSGERKDVTNTEKTWLRRERGLGKFMRTIDLPNEIDSDRVVARFDNGILLVTLPIQEKAKPRRISVKAN
jgi:HSP20 family protein